MKQPKDQQLVMVSSKDGKLEYGRFYKKSYSTNGPIFEVYNPGGNLIYTPDEIESWRPLTNVEIKQYDLD